MTYAVMSHNVRPLDLMVGWFEWSANPKLQMIVQNSPKSVTAIAVQCMQWYYPCPNMVWSLLFKYCIIWLFLCRHVLGVAQLKRQCGAGMGRQRPIWCVMLVRWESVESVAKILNSTRSQICHQLRRMPWPGLLDAIIYRPYLTQPCAQTQ